MSGTIKDNVEKKKNKFFKFHSFVKLTLQSNKPRAKIPKSFFINSKSYLIP